MNTHVRNSGFPAGQGSPIAAYDSETGVIQDATSLRDLAAYHRYLLLRSHMAGGENGRRQDKADKQK